MAAEDVLTRSPPPADARVAYGPGRHRFIDVRRPSSARPGPGVLHIHGGFWQAAYGLEHAGHLCAALREAGVATFNVEYRRVGEPGGGWPGSLADVRSAYRFVRRSCPRYRVDPRHLLVMGHSAGGQLALCLAANEPSVREVVSLAGVLDLRRASMLRLGEGAVEAFLGGGPETVPERYRLADPMELSIPHARQWVLHGIEDSVIPVELARNYVRTKSGPAAAPGGKSELVEFEEIAQAGHFELIDPRSDAFLRVVDVVRRAAAGRCRSRLTDPGATGVPAVLR